MIYLGKDLILSILSNVCDLLGFLSLKIHIFNNLSKFSAILLSNSVSLTFTVLLFTILSFRDPNRYMLGLPFIIYMALIFFHISLPIISICCILSLCSDSTSRSHTSSLALTNPLSNPFSE